MATIQKAEMQDMESILDIWLNASLQAHGFIPASYWEQQLLPMRDLYLPLAENYVIKDNQNVTGFASLLKSEAVLAALFIAPHQQGLGYGTALIDFFKQQCDELHLNVYTENTAAVHFYQQQGFKIISQAMDKNTGHAELSINWENIRKFMSAVIEYNEDNYSDFEWFEGFAVIRFYANWCVPCVQNFPVFEQLVAHYAAVKPEIKFGKINVDQSQILTLRYNVYGLPSTLIFKNGQIIQRIAGVKSLNEMKSIIDSMD